MNKKRLTICIVLIGIVLFGGGLFAYNEGLFGLSNKATHYYVSKVGEQYLLFPISSQQANYKLTDDQVLQKQYIQNPKLLEEMLSAEQLSEIRPDGTLVEFNSEKVTVDYEEGTLELLQTKVGEQYFIIPEKGKTDIVLNTNMEGTLYVFSSNLHNVYSINPQTLEVIKVTSEHINNYSRKEMQSYGTGSFIRSYEPLLSADGNYISYMSTRRSALENDMIDDIWFFEINTGTEQLLIENAKTMFWGKDRLYYYSNSTKSILGYNYVDESHTELFKNVELYQYLSKEWIAFRYYNNPSIYIYNANSNHLTSLSTEENGSITLNFELSPNEELLLGTLFQDRSDATTRKFYVFNLVKQEKTVIDMPGDHPLLTTIDGWLSNEIFIADMSSSTQAFHVSNELK